MRTGASPAMHEAPKEARASFGSEPARIPSTSSTTHTQVAAYVLENQLDGTNGINKPVSKEVAPPSVCSISSEDGAPPQQAPRATTYSMIPAHRDSHDGIMDDLQSLDGLIDDLQSVEEETFFEDLKEKPGDARTIPDDMLQTSPATGLCEGEVVFRRHKYGLNQLREEKPKHLKKLLMFFVGPIQFVMEAAACLAFGLQKWIDAGVICALLLLNAAVGFIQEFHAGNIVNELKKTLTSKCTVLRGHVIEVEARMLVPGDLVHLDEGSIVPADGRIITLGIHLQVDQSAITGESLPTIKATGDTVYQSSTIKCGEAAMIVTATGDSTFVGRSAALVNAAATGAGHFTEVINLIGLTLLAIVLLTLVIVWISSLYRSNGMLQILHFTLAITVVGVPVGLPAVVTTTMAVGASHLAKKKAIVRKLSAIESLAGVEVLCSDKTGTLTKNKLTLGLPSTMKGVHADDLMLTACLAASRKRKGLDAIDKAFLKALKPYWTVKHALSEFKIIEFSPFNPVSKRVTAVARAPGGELFTCVKGSPTAVLNMVLAANPISEAILEDYHNKVEEFAGRGFRSLTVARKRGSGDWEILGVMPCSDPPRHDAATTISEAKAMGLSVKMLTGDAVGIAKETSRQLGLGDNVYDSERLGEGGSTIADSNLYDFVHAADGFAEVYPQHKYNVVEILQQRGLLVAMTGDGVNDAPSLKRADTGIAVEGASDAARSAADIVFLAPGLSAIVDALKTSRQIFHRMYAYIVYRIALSLHLLLFLGLWIAIMNRTLNLMLIVFIAIFADVATLAIAYDNAPYSRLPVKWNLPKLWGLAILLGVILAAGTFICLTTMLLASAGGIVQNAGNLEAVLFLEIALSQNWLIFITRAAGHWKSVPSWQLCGAILVVDALATVMCFFGWFLEAGRTHWLTLVRVWGFSVGVFFVCGAVFWVCSEGKWFDGCVRGRCFGERGGEGKGEAVYKR